MSPNRKRRTARLLGAASVVALAFGLLPVSPASADHPDPPGALVFTEACANAPEDAFTDDDASIHETAIDCIAFYEVTSGKTATTYAPAESVRRDQMATFIAQEIDYASDNGTGTALPAAPATNPFPCPSDPSLALTPANVHYDNIVRLAEAGIVSGGVGGAPADCYGPALNVRRDQMATFIVAGVEFSASTDLASTTDYFADDDDSVHEANINAGASEGLIAGRGTNAAGHNVYEPSSDIRRDQMAAFLARSVQYLVDQGIITPKGDAAGQATATTRPELVSAAIGSTTTTGQASPGNPAGTRVSYVFDENIDLFGATATAFHVYNADGTTAGNGTETMSRTDNTVVVNFANLDTAAEVTPLTLATVDLGAVTDDQGQQNPEGDAPIGTAAAPGTTGSAGITSAPDLASVGNFRASATQGSTAVDFTFDEAAFVLNANGFDLIQVNGAELDCVAPTGTQPGGGTSIGGNGTTTITVVCENESTGLVTAAPTLTAAGIARGTVAEDTVGDATGGTGNLNALQAADVSNAGNTSEPDLVSAEFRPSAGTADDQVLFVFDEAVTSAVAARFFVYDTAANDTAGTGTAVINSTDPKQVLVNFPDGTLTNAVGANVIDAAVQAADNTLPNQQDEVGVANTQTTTGRTPGETAAPQLDSVALDQAADAFGNPTGFRATYTFDEPVTFAGVTPGDFFLYLADGTRLQATTCARVAASGAAAGTAGEDQVRCTAYGTATSAQIGSATAGTVDDGAVTDGTNPNPEGYEVTTGGTGTPGA